MMKEGVIGLKPIKKVSLPKKPLKPTMGLSVMEEILKAKGLKEQDLLNPLENF